METCLLRFCAAAQQKIEFAMPLALKINSLDLGAYIGLTGWICDAKRNIELRKSIKSIPLDRLMLETDCPYLIPKNLPEKPAKNINEPKYLPHIASEISKLIEVDIEEIRASTYDNAMRFFN